MSASRPLKVNASLFKRAGGQTVRRTDMRALKRLVTTDKETTILSLTFEVLGPASARATLSSFTVSKHGLLNLLCGTVEMELERNAGGWACTQSD
jgi:hypothetical protein